MSGHLEGDIITPAETSNADVIRVERVWQHRHDLELTIPKHRHNRTRMHWEPVVSCSVRSVFSPMAI